MTEQSLKQRIGLFLIFFFFLRQISILELNVTKMYINSFTDYMMSQLHIWLLKDIYDNIFERIKYLGFILIYTVLYYIVQI